MTIHRHHTVSRPVPAAIALSTLTAALLSACGGGGGSSGPDPVQPLPMLAITSANYQTVAAQSVAAGAYLTNAGAGSVLGVDAQAAPQPLMIARREALRLGARLAQAQGGMVTGAVTVLVQPCSLGGSMEISLNDANGNQALDAGDAMSLKATGCREADGTLDGQMDFAIKSVSGTFGSDQYSATVSVKLSNLRATNASSSTTGQGEFQMTISATGVDATAVSMTIPSFKTSGSVAGTAFQTTLTAFSLNVSTAPVGFIVRQTLNFGGTINSSVLEGRDITVSTTVPVIQDSNLDYPSSGQLLSKGANGSQVRVTAQGGSKALIELDANGDNVFETSVQKNWIDLL